MSSHLVSDVPVGVFLSGGIDSSALVAVLSHNGVRANTFSLVFQEEEFNEGQYSREIARRFGTEHHEIPISQQDTLAVLPEALRAMDQPTIDGINTYLVSAKTRAAGVKVALTGLGADEMFAGYSNFRRVPRMEAFRGDLDDCREWSRRPLAASVALFAGKDDRSRKLAELAAGQEILFVHPYFLVRMLFGAEEREALFLAPDHQASATISRPSAARVDHSEPISRSSQPRLLLGVALVYAQHAAAGFRFHEHGAWPGIARPLSRSAAGGSLFPHSGKQEVQGNSPKSLLLASLGVELPQGDCKSSEARIHSAL